MRVIDTDPQVAIVGMNEDDLIRRDTRYGKVMLPLSAISASATTDTKLGFIKFLTNPQNKILGAIMMAPNAAMALQEVAMVMRHNLSLIEIASTPHVYGEWGELVRMAAKKLL
jgi:pyruvate/2-oxoglutarate dehydrogenase complex dihydrolipoamide dehydrogenase (E3) component